MIQIDIFLGAPGAGKGTVAGFLAEQGHATHISTGAMLREAVKNGTPAGLAAKSYMDQGALVPDPVLLDMIQELLAATPDGTELLFDGFPRNTSQAEQLDLLAKKQNAQVKCAICLDVPQDVILRRLGGRRCCPACGATFHVDTLPPKQEGICDACGAALIVRNDDKPETIQHRLAVYAAQTEPLIAWYSDRQALRHVDGTGEVSAIAQRVQAALAD